MARNDETRNLKLRNGTWWLWARRSGKLLRLSLKTADLDTACAERDRILAPFNLKDEAKRAAKLADDAKTAEERAKAAAEAEAKAKAKAEAERKGLHVADAWEAFCNSPRRRKCAPATLTDTGQQWGRFAAWWQAHAPARPRLADVTAADGEDFARHLKAEGLSGNRYNKYLATLRRFWKLLLPDKPNPWEELARQPLEPMPHRPLAEQEIRALLDTAQGEMRRLLIIGAMTGLRLADAVTLRWEAVDFEAGLIRVAPRKTRRKRVNVVYPPLVPPLRAELCATPEAEQTGFIMPALAARYEHNRAAVCKDVRQVFRAAGIEAESPEGTASYHSLRHTFISDCERGGVSLATVRELVGHESDAVQRVYLHVRPAEAAEAVARALPDYTRDALPEAECEPLSAAEALAELRAVLRRPDAVGPACEAARAVLARLQ